MRQARNELGFVEIYRDGLAFNDWTKLRVSTSPSNIKHYTIDLASELERRMTEFSNAITYKRFSRGTNF
jgi:hypothetical protein